MHHKNEFTVLITEINFYILYFSDSIKTKEFHQINNNSL